MDISWDAGEAFQLVMKTTSKLQPRTLITYFPALSMDSRASRQQPTISFF
jgi:hypothetical protein